MTVSIDTDIEQTDIWINPSMHTYSVKIHKHMYIYICTYVEIHEALQETRFLPRRLSGHGLRASVTRQFSHIVRRGVLVK